MKTYDEKHPKYVFLKVLYSDTQDGVKLINEDGETLTGGETLGDFVHTATKVHPLVEALTWALSELEHLNAGPQDERVAVQIDHAKTALQKANP